MKLLTKTIQWMAVILIGFAASIIISVATAQPCNQSLTIITPIPNHDEFNYIVDYEFVSWWDLIVSLIN